MNIKPLCIASLMLVLPLFANAGTVTFEQGAAGDANPLPVIAASPGFANVITFSNLSAQVAGNSDCIDNAMDCPTFTPSTYAAQGAEISSPDTLLIYPFSSQTAGGIELFDPGAGGDLDGTANITISLAGGVSNIAVGIAEFDDPITLTIEALGAGNTVLASMDVSLAVEAAESATNLGNTYFVAQDTTPDIYGLEILQTTPTYGSGLALGEVEFSEVTPEPSTFLLLIGGGLASMGAARLRKKI